MKCGLILMIVIHMVNTEIPVECYNCNITGIWKFQMTVPEHKASPTLNDCGHTTPDKAETAPESVPKY